MKNYLRGLVACVLATASAGAALAQAAYPNQKIAFVVPFTPGGAGDLIARAIANKMAEAWRQPVVIENRAGAGGNTGSLHAAKAAPDGHTILIGSTSSHAINSSLYKEKMPYDVERDFASVMMVATSPHILLVNKSLPVKNVTELVAYAKANPGKINFSSGGNGTTTHLAGELFRTLTGTDMVHVPYKGAPEGVQGVMGGQTQMMFENLSGALPQLGGDRLRGLGISSERPIALVPGMPAVAETVPGFETAVWFGIFVPVRTPADVVAKLNAEINRILLLPDIKERFAKMGMQAMGGSSAEAARYVKAEIAKWADVVKASGASID
jgi:tripartite-type tricarboxylate transporter receptor subunit TctC